MEKLSIKIKIADREYPMKVAKEKEEYLRAAGKLINKKIKKYQVHFGIDDRQDLLAMIAFDCFVDKITNDKNLETIDHTIAEKINHLNQLISESPGEGGEGKYNKQSNK